jgi:hypothetical protein
MKFFKYILLALVLHSLLFFGVEVSFNSLAESENNDVAQMESKI